MRLAFLILLFVFACAARAQTTNLATGDTIATGDEWVNVAGAACSTTDTTNSWDEFLEGFQTATTGYEEANWLEVGTTANISPAYDSSALTTYKPPGACDQALRIIVPADGTETYSYVQLDQEFTLSVTQIDVYYSFYIESELATGKQVTQFSYRSTSTPAATQGVQIGNTTGQSWVFALGATNSSAINVSDGQWNTVKLSYDTAAAAGGSTITVFANGAVVGSETFTRSAEAMEYLFFGGAVGVSTDEGYTVLFDVIAVKSN